MSEWKLKKIGKVADLYQGLAINSKTKHLLVEDGPRLPLLRIKDLLENSEEFFVDHQNAPKKSLVDIGDLIFTRTGQVGYVFNNRKGVLHNNCFKIIPKDERVLSSDFLYHYFNRENVRDYLESISAGSVQPDMNHSIFKLVEIPVPPIEEQNAIAEVLSSLDDKIDLLHHQNQTLELMAETLFRQWFVEEAVDDWEIVQLQDIAEVKNGFAFSSKSYVDYSPEHLEVLKMGHIEKGGGLRTDPKRDYAPREERLERYILDKGDIVMAMTDMKDNVVILGVPAMIDESDRYVLNQRVARIYLKNRDSLINEYLLYVQLKDPDFIAELQSKANSGVQVNLSTSSIKESEILVPPVELQIEKGNSITDLYLKKEYNDKQIKSLTKLRETLLPKLMSGEIRLTENG